MGMVDTMSEIALVASYEVLRSGVIVDDLNISSLNLQQTTKYLLLRPTVLNKITNMSKQP